MTNEDIEKAAKEAIKEHYNCNGKYPCSERSYCIFCDGENTAYDCNECGADEFYEGFLKAANWRINSVWHDASEIPDIGEVIIVELFGKVWDYGTYNVGDSIHPKAKWAYMNDLIPSKED